MKNVLLATMVLLHNICDPGHKLYSQSAKKKRRGMALVRTGGGVAEISGSIGGTTFSRNRSGAYARNRSNPVDPNTASQQKVRSAVALLAYNWFNVLTATQRAAWALYADNVSVVNRLGDSINLTGYNMYQRTNIPLINADMAEVDSGPTVFTLPDADPTAAIAVSEATQNASITFDNTLDWANEDDAALLVYISRPQNASVNFFKGPYRLAGTVDGDGTTAPTSPATIAVPFPVVEGQKIFCQCRIVRADGRLSNPFRFACDVGS